MTAIEKGIYVESIPEDLKVINLIVSRLSLFDGYYGEFTRLHTELKYKEFTTLSDDFKGFHRQIVHDSGKYSVMELASLKRSLILLRDRNNTIDSLWAVWFQNFLNESIHSLDKWLNEILEQIIEDV